MERATLHAGRTGFPLGRFSTESKHLLSSLESFQSEMVTVAHSLENIPLAQGLSANRMTGVSAFTHFLR